MTKRSLWHLEGIGAGLVACALVLAGATEAAASISPTCAAHSGNAEGRVPLGWDLVFDNGVAVGLYGIDFEARARAGMYNSASINSFTLTETGLGLGFGQALELQQRLDVEGRLLRQQTDTRNGKRQQIPEHKPIVSLR